jgi:hypothetical protein
MRRSVLLFAPFFLLFLLSACDADLPGLRVLRGETTPQELAQQAVETTELVMADKSGSAEPVLLMAADRIEAAALGTVDVIEVREDPDTRTMDVAVLIRFPQSEGQQAQVDQFETLRRALEVTWQATARVDAVDLISVTVLAPQSITTLDNGESFIGAVLASSAIERSSANAYLSGDRSLAAFVDLIAQGTLTYTSPSGFELYDGQPNHPMFMFSEG